MEIIPAILPRDFAEIEEKILQIKGIVNNVQIDICDGKFVPSITWPYKKADINFEKILREEMGMPEWDNIDYEYDLMIKNPNEDDARKWMTAGAKRITFHLESSDDLNPAISVLDSLVEIGISIDIKTDIAKLDKYINKIQYIQCMGIDKVGFQGQKFDADVLKKIKEIKIKYPNIIVQVDGGVSLENAQLLKHEGVDRVIVGSALFESDNIVDSIAKFKRI